MGFYLIMRSPRRGENFVTRKITIAIAERAKGHKNILKPAILIRAVIGVMQRIMLKRCGSCCNKMSNYFIKLQWHNTHKVREFVQKAYKKIDIDIVWQGAGSNGLDKATGETIVKVDPKLYRTCTKLIFCEALPTKAKNILGWRPETEFNTPVNLMVASELGQDEESGDFAS